MKTRYLVLLAISAFVVTLIVRFPADVVLANVNTAPVVVSNPGGTVWRGEAYSIGVGVNRIDDVTWRLNPLTLFAGKVGANVDFKVLGGDGVADVARALNGDVFVSDADVKVSAAALSTLIPNQLVELGGQFHLQLEDSHFTPQHPQSLKGVLTWQSAALRSPVQAALGAVTVTFVPNATGHTAQLKNEGGVLSISGQVDVDTQGGYRADIRLQPRPNAPADIDGTLGLLARKGSDGSYRLRHNGRLVDFF